LKRHYSTNACSYGIMPYLFFAFGGAKQPTDYSWRVIAWLIIRVLLLWYLLYLIYWTGISTAAWYCWQWRRGGLCDVYSTTAEATIAIANINDGVTYSAARRVCLFDVMPLMLWRPSGNRIQPALMCVCVALRISVVNSFHDWYWSLAVWRRNGACDGFIGGNMLARWCWHWRGGVRIKWRVRLWRVFWRQFVHCDLFSVADQNCCWKRHWRRRGPVVTTLPTKRPGRRATKGMTTLLMTLLTLLWCDDGTMKPVSKLTLILQYWYCYCVLCSRFC